MSGIDPKRSRPPEIRIPSHMPMAGMGELKAKEFIDIEGGASGMMIAPEGVGPEDAIVNVETNVKKRCTGIL